MHPVTFLTHFRIPALPLLFFLLPCWPRGRQCSGPSESTPWTTAACAPGCQAQRGTLRKPVPSHLRLLLHVLPPGHMSSRAPVGNFFPKPRLFAPPTLPPAKPLAGGNGNADSGLQTRFPPSPGLRGPRVEGALPFLSPRRNAEGGCARRPPPARLRWKPGLLVGAGRGCFRVRVGAARERAGSGR